MMMLANIKLEIKRLYEYILSLDTFLDSLIFNGRAKTKLEMLTLYCREFVKKLLFCL